jgi:hypothetical protein
MPTPASEGESSSSKQGRAYAEQASVYQNSMHATSLQRFSSVVTGRLPGINEAKAAALTNASPNNNAQQSYRATMGKFRISLAAGRSS